MQNNINKKKNFERINYSLRPAKHIERKMFCETFNLLSILDNLSNYRYIGMGSAYFSDFSLFHRALGITKMVSIEGEKKNIYKQRIRFNKPFACIDVEFGMTYEVLPKLPWDKWKQKSIIWLDYVDRFQEQMFGDIDTVIFNCKPGSVFLLSVNIEEDDERDLDLNINHLSPQEFKLNQLIENVGSESVPYRANNMILDLENNKKIIREIIDNAILNAVNRRNYGESTKNQLEYLQIFNIHYKDTADMLTVGGILYNSSQKEKIDIMFNNLDFIRYDEKCFNIIVPKLTYREIYALDMALPNSSTLKTGKAKFRLKNIPLSTNDIKNYANIYRYFPTFAETTL